MCDRHSIGLYIVCPRGQPIGTIDLVSSVPQGDNLLVLLILYLVFLKGTTSHNLLVLLIFCLVYPRETTIGTVDSVSSFPEGDNLLVQLILCLV